MKKLLLIAFTLTNIQAGNTNLTLGLFSNTTGATDTKFSLAIYKAVGISNAFKNMITENPILFTAVAAGLGIPALYKTVSQIGEKRKKPVFAGFQGCLGIGSLLTIANYVTCKTTQAFLPSIYSKLFLDQSAQKIRWGIIGISAVTVGYQAWRSQNRFLNQSPLNVNGLFDDMQRYQITQNGSCHAGHLYEHSVWSLKAMQSMIKKKSQWLLNITEKDDFKLLEIAAFMHDIGKAGDNKTKYLNKPDHPDIGFGYILDRKEYYLNKNKKTYNFNTWASSLGINDEQKKTIAVLVGMHQELAPAFIAKNSEDGKFYGKDITDCFEKYLIQLQSYVTSAEYNNGNIDVRILNMCLAIYRADFEGVQEVNYDGECYFPLPNETKNFEKNSEENDTKKITSPCCYTDIPNKKMIDTSGLESAQELIGHFKTHYHEKGLQPEYDAKKVEKLKFTTTK